MSHNLPVAMNPRSGRLRILCNPSSRNKQLHKGRADSIWHSVRMGRAEGKLPLIVGMWLPATKLGATPAMPAVSERKPEALPRAKDLSAVCHAAKLRCP